MRRRVAQSRVHPAAHCAARLQASRSRPRGPSGGRARASRRRRGQPEAFICAALRRPATANGTARTARRPIGRRRRPIRRRSLRPPSRSRARAARPRRSQRRAAERDVDEHPHTRAVTRTRHAERAAHVLLVHDDVVDGPGRVDHRDDRLERGRLAFPLLEQRRRGRSRVRDASCAAVHGSVPAPSMRPAFTSVGSPTSGTGGRGRSSAGTRAPALRASASSRSRTSSVTRPRASRRSSADRPSRRDHDETGLGHLVDASRPGLRACCRCRARRRRASGRRAMWAPR